MKMILPFAVAAILSLFLFWCRRGGGGVIGRKVRNSDHWALEDAIHEKKEEVDRLTKEVMDLGRKHPDYYYLCYEWNDAKAELEQLVALRPKYPLDNPCKS